MRALSGLERVWLAADRICPPFVNQLVIEGDGALAVPEVEAAVVRAAAAHPGVCAVLRGGLGWARWVQGTRLPQVVDVDGSAWRGFGPLGAPFLGRQLSTDRVCEVVVAGDRLIVRTLHAALDGRGTWLFAEDLFACLRGEEPTGAVGGPQTDADVAAALGVDAEGDTPVDRAAPTGLADGTDLAVTWLRERVEGRPTEVLPRAIAAIWAVSRRWTEGPLRVAVSVDLRRHRPDLRTSANLSGIFRIELHDLPPDLVGYIESALHAGVDSGAAAAVVLRARGVRWLPLALMERVGRRKALEGFATGLWATSATVSNLGRQPVERLACDGFRARHAFWIPPGSPGHPMFVALSGDAHGVDVCASAPVPLATGGRLEAVVEAVAGALVAT